MENRLGEGFMDKEKIRKRIMKEVDQLPAMSRNVIKIRNLAENPNSEIKDIADVIKQDLAMAADILKVGNSAKYVQRSKVETVESAVKIIGLREVKAIAMSFEAKRLLEEKYPEMIQIWEHSYKVGFYAQQLKRILISKRSWEDIYLAGLLHDMGKIILYFLSPELMEKIKALSVNKKVALTVVERMVLGLTHSDIGAMICRKWNYPERVTQCVRYHHEPSMAIDAYRESVYAVYLANEIANIEEGAAINYANLDRKCMDYFGLYEEEDFLKTKNTLIKLYDELTINNEDQKDDNHNEGTLYA